MSLSPTFLTFNVAGQRFTTSKDTLLKEPASRLAMLARGVLPAMKDDSGSIFLDRDAKYFQLMLNYLRDGWCSLPCTPNERRELLQEVRWYQLSSMEAWLKAQEVALTLNEAANLARPSSAPLDAFSRSSLLSAASSPATPAQNLFAAANNMTSPFNVTTAVAGSPGLGSMYSSSTSPNSSPFRSSSFLTGANQDLLAAGALASCGVNSSSLTSRHSTPSLLFGNQPQPLLFSTAGSGTLGNKVSLVGVSAPVPVPGAGQEAAAAAGYMGAYSVAGAAANSAAASAGSPPRIPLPMAADGYKWTHRLLQTNPKMQEAINTLLELAYLPPHTSLHAGKVGIAFTSECTHDLGLTGRTSSLMLLSAQQQLEAARFRNMVIRVSSNLGWAFELAVRAASNVALHDKYNIAGFLQDNWFMVTAILKEQYGIILEEDLSARPNCLACRRHNITLSLQRVL